MPAIRPLDPHLAAKIAAGEVIERPASVVKELVENALDAGATWVEVRIEDGGIERIAVSDNGRGIPAAELELAFRRHATSKLVAEADLATLRTLGFRGEALPSIAAVADVTCSTRAAEEAVGSELRIEAGALEQSPLARQGGTTLVAEGLFARFPARRKFLRSRGAETAACLQVIQPLTLAFPEVRFSLVVDGREALRTPGNGALRSAALAIFGVEADAHLATIPPTRLDDDAADPFACVDGLAGTGSLHRSNRSGLFLLVNRRPVQNRSLTFAATEAYGSLVPTGRYPVGVLRVEVPPDEVDFNVHPSKLEVKLLRERAVFAAVQKALRATLGAGGSVWPVPAWGVPPPGAAPDAWARLDAPVPLGSPQVSLPYPHAAPNDLLSGGDRLEALRVLGQAGRTYVIAEGDAGVYLVDQHAAHERVLLEELRQALIGRTEQQLLLEAVVVDLPPEAAATADAAVAGLAGLGFDVELFGPRQLLLRAVPAVMAARQPGRIVVETLTALAANAHGLRLDEQVAWPERLALVLACKTAVKAGDALDVTEMESLLRRLGEAALCRTCAHGRPTAILLSHAQLEREFGRR